MADPNAHAYDDLVRRLAAAIRGATLYSPSHPLVQRGVDALAGLCATLAQRTDTHRRSASSATKSSSTRERLPKSAAALVGFARDMREREIEKITIQRGVTREELRTFIFELPDRRATHAAGDAAAAEGRHAASPSAGSSIEKEDDETGHGDRRGAQDLRHRGRDGRAALGRGQGGRQAGPERGAQDHRQPRQAGRRGPHVADGADGAEALRQLHLHAHGERLGAGDGAGALAQHGRHAAARVRLRGADARHRQGADAAGGAEQPGQAVEGRVRHHAAPRRGRRAHPAPHAGDARAGADRRLRASSAAGSVRVSGQHRPPQPQPVHADRQHRGRLRRAAQQPRLP